jgi:hypothetical protein
MNNTTSNCAKSDVVPATNVPAYSKKKKYKHHTKIYTDGSKKEGRVSYSVIWNKKSMATKHNLHRQKISNQNSHPLHNKRIEKKTNSNRLLKFIGCSLGQEGYKKPEKVERKLLGQEEDKI